MKQLPIPIQQTEHQMYEHPAVHNQKPEQIHAMKQPREMNREHQRVQPADDNIEQSVANQNLLQLQMLSSPLIRMRTIQLPTVRPSFI